MLGTSSSPSQGTWLGYMYTPDEKSVPYGNIYTHSDTPFSHTQSIGEIQNPNPGGVRHPANAR